METTLRGKPFALPIHGRYNMTRCRWAKRPHPFGIFYGENPLDFSFPLVLLQISVIVVITRAVRFLLKPLKQPRIISDIIHGMCYRAHTITILSVNICFSLMSKAFKAGSLLICVALMVNVFKGGIIIGPSVLGRSEKFSAWLFPDQGVFVLKNVAIMGMMYFLFVSGVKMDPINSMSKSGRKALYTAIVGIILPMGTVASISVLVWKFLDKDIARGASISAIASSLSITAFPVLYPILKELNLLNSEIGRLAMSTSMISDMIGYTAIVLSEAARQGATNHWNVLWYMISVLVLLAVIIGVLRPLAVWIVRQTPEGKPVDQLYVTFTMLIVLVLGFCSDFIGATVINGPLWFGLAMPDGPPLGAALVERSETVINDLLMPLMFAFVGLYTDVFSMTNFSTLGSLLVIILVGYIAKLFGTLLPSLYFKLPLREGLVLSLIMSLRGQVEMFLFLHWVLDYKFLKTPSFTLMVLLTTLVTAIATPLIGILYKPTRPYINKKRRTIQHAQPGSELHIVAGIHDKESVAALINLLEASNPTSYSPIVVYALHLVELVGRATPMFIAHKSCPENNGFDIKVSAFRILEQVSPDHVEINSFTSVSPYTSMYQDICDFALEKTASLIVIPFHKERLGGHGQIGLHRGVQQVNSNVIAHAPCSVGILVDRGPFRRPLMSRSVRGASQYNVAVLFLGGADAREALAYADRMVGKSLVSLTVVRFLSNNNEGDNVMEKKLDDGLVTWFWVKNEQNDRVVYKEVVVRNGEETVAAIQAMNSNSYDLWIMGRQMGINPVLVEGLSQWSDNPEMGVIGDYVTSSDFGCTASVLVVQQQVLSGA
ncbi:hypothetical protein HHK36_018797 [Tetracentron sinense]|uniref:Cation/H+ exchanger domain-containing protein n=1 Tax=Tetracentron sinense TaxID=13715 RepID=A0A834YWI9_TETSI|nr:hypothetical protein HHK36_018797 [Tetracentron sinense]